MDEVTFTKVRSQLPVMDEGANNEGKKYCLVRHKKKRLVVLSYEEYEDLIKKAGTTNNNMQEVEVTSEVTDTGGSVTFTPSRLHDVENT